MNLNDYNIDKIKDIKVSEIELEDEDLEHAGIKGMKWGERRYQNKDGSLTPLGRIHYNKGLKKKAKVEAKKTVKAEKKAKADETNSWKKLKKKKVSEMSSEELTKYKDRMKMEAEAMENANRHSAARTSKFKQFVDKIKNISDLLNSISSITSSTKQIKVNVGDLHKKKSDGTDTLSKLSKKEVSKMTDEELKTYTDRLKLETAAEVAKNNRDKYQTTNNTSTKSYATKYNKKKKKK